MSTSGHKLTCMLMYSRVCADVYAHLNRYLCLLSPPTHTTRTEILQLFLLSFELVDFFPEDIMPYGL